jgi:hypothetical protein
VARQYAEPFQCDLLRVMLFAPDPRHLAVPVEDRCTMISKPSTVATPAPVLVGRRP